MAFVRSFSQREHHEPENFPPSQKLDGLFLLALSMAVFFVGVTEFMLSSMLGPLAQAFHTTTSGAAWLISSYAFSYAIAAPLLGYFSDRMQRRKLLLLALILFAVDTLAIVIAPTLEIAVVLRVIGASPRQSSSRPPSPWSRRWSPRKDRPVPWAR